MPESYQDAALAILAIDDSRNETDNTAVFAGNLAEQRGTLWFYDDDETMSVIIPDNWRERIKPVPDAVRDILLDCDFVLRLEVAPNAPDHAAFQTSGLIWPAGEETAE